MLYKSLFYGQPGCGKTTLAATAADDDRLSPVLILNAFGNPEVLRKKANKPDVVEIEEMSDFNAPYEWIENGQDPKHKFCVENKLNPPYKTVVVDSLTEVQRFVVRAVTGGAYIKPGDLTPKMDRQGFGTLLGTMLNWATYYIKLDVNIILISHEAEKAVGGPGSMVRHSPLLWGQSGGELCGYVLQVVHLTTRLATPVIIRKDLDGSSYNVARFLETEQYYAKDQYDMGTEWMEAPTLTKIMDLIEQSA